MRRAHERRQGELGKGARRRAAGVGGAVLGVGLIAAPIADAATFTVENTDDSGPGSLRQAVLDANASATDDLIVFDSSVTGEIRLTSGEIDILVDGNADTPAQGDLTIEGPGQDVLAVSGDANGSGSPDTGDSRVIEARGAFGELSLSGLTLTEGFAEAQPIEVSGKYFQAGQSGGAFFSDVGDLTITDSSFTDSVTSKYGGGLAHIGNTFDFSGLTITGNEAANSGGGASVRAAGTLMDSAVSGNEASGSAASSKYTNSSTAAGIELDVETGGALIQAVEITGNEITTTTGSAGGIEITPTGGDTVIDDSTISGNSAPHAGGLRAYTGTSPGTPTTVSNSIVSDNEASTGTGGLDGALRVVGTRVTGNTSAGVGAGGISSQDRIEVRTSTIASNTSASGAGGVRISSTEEASISRSTISGNAGSSAGGIMARDPGTSEPNGFQLSNSTVSGNEVTGNSADPGARQGYGGGLYVRGVVGAKIENSTITGNSATQGGGGVFSYVGAADPGNYYDPANREISSTIVANNTAAGAPNDLAVVNPDNPGVGFKVGYSLIRNPAGAPIDASPAGSNLTGVDPQVAPLADNGGPTQTRMPALGSPAIDAGTANGLTVDQRGEPRTRDFSGVPNTSDGTDIGAVERNSVVPTPTITGGPGDGSTVRTSQVTFTFSTGGATTLECSLDGGAFSPCTSPKTYTGLADGSHTFRLRGTGADGNQAEVERTFTVDSEVERAFARGKKNQKQRGKKIRVKARFGAAEAVTGVAGGVIKVGKKRYPLSTVSRDVAAGSAAGVKLTPAKKRAARKVSKALKRGKSVKAMVTVELTDAAGNSVKLPLRVKLK